MNYYSLQFTISICTIAASPPYGSATGQGLTRVPKVKTKLLNVSVFKTIVFEVILTSLDENKQCGKILSINWQNKDLVKLAQNPGGIVAFPLGCPCRHGY